MDKKSGEGQPRFESPAPKKGQEITRERAMETSQDQEAGLGKQLSKQATVPATISLPADIATAQPQAPTAKPSTVKSPTTDLAADDVDLIEKQWVERAKAIVAQTQDDPHKQKTEISRAGADYIKKRFNKTIPTEDTMSA